MKMTCDEVRRSIPLFLDDELDAEYGLELEEHLNQCQACRNELEREGRLRLTLRRAAQSIVAPASLRRRVQESIEREQRHQSRWSKAWPAAAAAAVLLAFVWKGAFETSSLGLDRELIERMNWPPEVVAADVAPVQSYLRNRLPFALEVPQLRESKTVSLGGRVVPLGDRQAAYVRYEVPGGRIAIFVYEDQDRSIPEVVPGFTINERRVRLNRVRGYTTAHWRSRGLIYSVVSDLPEPDLYRIVGAVSRHPAR